MTHGGVRWKTCSRATFGCSSGTNWIADAPVPIAATRSPVTSWSWSQRAEWKTVPSKRSSPGRSGTRGSASGPTPAIRTRASTGARGRLQPPAPGRVVPRGARHRHPEPDERCGVVPLRAALQVGADLGLRGVRPAPLGVRRERERVEVRGDVARAAGVGVRPPGAADVVVALEHDEVVDPLLAQPDRRAQAGEARADDRDVGHTMDVSP